MPVVTEHPVHQTVRNEQCGDRMHYCNSVAGRIYCEAVVIASANEGARTLAHARTHPGAGEREQLLLFPRLITVRTGRSIVR